MTVTFGTMTKDKNYVGKEATEIAEKSCQLKGDCSITDPVLIVTGDPETYAACNYFSIPDFGRHYYVTGGPTVLPGGLLEIRGHCDVLASAWPQLRGLSAVIDRQENEFNLMLNDGTFQAQANDQVITKDFPQGFGTPSYVLVVAG